MRACYPNKHASEEGRSHHHHIPTWAMDWGIITGEGVHVPLSSFQASKRFLLVLAHYLTVLCPLTTGFAHRAPTSRTPPRKMQRQRSMNLTRVEWEDPALASPSSPSWATTQETPAISIENLTIRGRAPRVSTNSSLQSPRQETWKRPGNVLTNKTPQANASLGQGRKMMKH